MRLPQRMRGWLVGASAALLLSACSKAEPRAEQTPPAPRTTEHPAPEAQSTPQRAAAAPSPAPCTNSMYRGFVDPPQAYAAYAEATQADDWCKAINTYAPTQRAEVALSNFKALAMLAGADNPKRFEYEEGFRRFCTEQQLGCGSAQSATELAQAIMLRLPLEAQLAPLRARLEQAPEDVYVALMTQLAAVDSNAVGRFALPLAALQLEGEHAVAQAPQRDGKTSRVSFVKTPAGWMLALR